MNTENIRMIPLSVDEIEEIQATVVFRMIELNRSIKDGTIHKDQVPAANKEIAVLGKVVEKVAKSYAS